MTDPDNLSVNSEVYGKIKKIQEGLTILRNFYEEKRNSSQPTPSVKPNGTKRVSSAHSLKEEKKPAQIFNTKSKYKIVTERFATAQYHARPKERVH